MRFGTSFACLAISTCSSLICNAIIAINCFSEIDDGNITPMHLTLGVAATVTIAAKITEAASLLYKIRADAAPLINQDIEQQAQTPRVKKENCSNASKFFYSSTNSANLASIATGAIGFVAQNTTAGIINLASGVLSIGASIAHFCQSDDNCSCCSATNSTSEDEQAPLLSEFRSGIQ